MKNAQAIFSLVLLLAFVPLLFTTIVRMGEVEEETETIGETILELKKTTDNAEKTLFYLEQAGRYVVYSIVGEIEGDLSICEGGYIKNILGLFEQKLKIYISKYPMINLLANNYDIIIIDSGRLLIANAKSDLSESFGKGTYLFNPSFSVPFGYDIINLCS